MASACPAWLKQAWINWLGPDRIWERYGGSEGFGSTAISGSDWLSHPGSVGRIIGGSELRIKRDDGTRCDPGEVGELFFRPDSNKPTAYYLGADIRRDEDGFLSTGDLGHIDSEGFVYLADRRTDLIIRGGANIYPAEIEAALDAHPQIGSSLVIGLPDDAMGAQVHAIVQPASTGVLDIGDIHAFLRGRFVPYKLPESYEIVNSPLRDEAGKARRTALRDERIRWRHEGIPFAIDPRQTER